MTYPSSTKFKPTYRKKCRNELLELCAGRHLQVDQSDSKDKLAQSLVDYDIAKDPYVHRTKLELAALLRARNLVVAIRDPKTDMVRRLLEDDQRIASNIRGDGDSATSTSVYGSSAYKSADDSGSDTSDSSISSLYESDGAGSRTSEAGSSDEGTQKDNRRHQLATHDMSRSAAHDTLTTTPTSAIHDTLTTTPTSAAHDTLTTTPTSAIHDTLTTTPTSAAHDILTATLPSAASSLVLAAPEPLSMSTHSPQILFTSDGNTAEERMENWPMHGLKVRVIRHRRTVTPYKDGIHDKHKGQVLRVDNSRRTCCVQLLEGRLSVLKSISWDHLEPVQPRKYEKVKVIKGEFRGRLGELCWTNENDGLVRFMETSEYKFVNMVDLAKYLGNKM